jgi:TPR repeat protein
MKLIEGWVNRTIENLNLRQAFLLRKDGRLVESHAAFEAACKEGDGKALYLKSRALFTGGWLYERNYRASEECRNTGLLTDCTWLFPSNSNRDDAFTRLILGYAEDGYKQGIAAGHFLVYAYPIMRGIDTSPNVLEAANFGDERCQYQVGRRYKNTNPKLAFEYFLKGATQKHKKCMYKVARYYEKGKGCSKDLMKAAESFIAGDFIVQIPDRMHFAYKEGLWDLVYVYARACKKNTQLYYMTDGSTECKAGLIMYDMTKKRVQETVFWFTLIFRKYGFLSKDMRRVVGEKIWDTRYKMDLWNNIETKPEAKKIKIK